MASSLRGSGVGGYYCILMVHITALYYTCSLVRPYRTHLVSSAFFERNTPCQANSLIMGIISGAVQAVFGLGKKIGGEGYEKMSRVRRMLLRRLKTLMHTSTEAEELRARVSSLAKLPRQHRNRSWQMFQEAKIGELEEAARRGDHAVVHWCSREMAGTSLGAKRRWFNTLPGLRRSAGEWLEILVRPGCAGGYAGEVIDFVASSKYVAHNSHPQAPKETKYRALAERDVDAASGVLGNMKRRRAFPPWSALSEAFVMILNPEYNLEWAEEKRAEKCEWFGGRAGDLTYASPHPRSSSQAG